MFQWTLAKASPEADSRPCPGSWLAELHTGLEITFSAANLSLQTSNREDHMLSTRFLGFTHVTKLLVYIGKNKKTTPSPQKPHKYSGVFGIRTFQKYSFVGGGKFWLPMPS